MMTNLLQKTLGMAGRQNYGSVVRPRMYVASLDIKTAFVEARPRHVAKIMESHDTHPWMDCFSSVARDGWVTSPGYVRKRGEQFLVQSVSPQRKRQSSLIVAKDGHAGSGKCGGELDKEKNGHPFGFGKAKGTSNLQLHVDRQLLDHVPLQNFVSNRCCGI